MKRSRYVIGKGITYEFPIVREGNIRGSLISLGVGNETFALALKDAVQWALVYSADQGASHYPLVRYRSELSNEKRYVMRLDCNFAYTESVNAGAWLPVITLETV